MMATALINVPAYLPDSASAASLDLSIGRPSLRRFDIQCPIDAPAAARPQLHLDLSSP